MMKQSLFRSGVRVFRSLSVCVGVLCAGALSASAFSPFEASSFALSTYNVSYTPDLYPQPGVSDPCASLLNASLDPVASGTRQPDDAIVSKAAVLSLALGVRMAIGPLERTGPVAFRSEPVSAHDIKSAPALSAQSIAAYRFCRKGQALLQIKGLPHPG